MDHDLLLMIYGALIGAVSRVIASMVESTFDRWLEHREQERQQSAEQKKRVTQIYLPTPEEVQAITSQQYQENQAAAQSKAVGTGTIVLSVVGGGFLIHQAREPILSLVFTALISYLLINSLFTRLKR
jgi:hypothetical protein